MGVGGQGTLPPSPNAGKRTTRSEQTFPFRLHVLLTELEHDGMQAIASWQPHGRCFLINDQKRLVTEILPTWFQQTKYSSFQRQLNLYGFKRFTTGPDKGAYYHPFFLRYNPDLCHKIKRFKVKGTGIRGRSDPDSEPNFYLYPTLTPTSGTASVEQGVDASRVERGSESLSSFTVAAPYQPVMSIPSHLSPNLASVGRPPAASSQGQLSRASALVVDGILSLQVIPREQQRRQRLREESLYAALSADLERQRLANQILIAQRHQELVASRGLRDTGLSLAETVMLQHIQWQQEDQRIRQGGTKDRGRRDSPDGGSPRVNR